MFPAIAACCMLQDSCVTTLLWMLSLIATPTELGVVIASQLSGCSPPLETHVFLRRIALGSIGEYFNRRKRKHCRSIVKLGDQREAYNVLALLACVCIARSRFLARHLSISKLWMNDLPQRQPLLSALSCKAEGVEPTHHDAFRVYDEP